MIDTLYKTVLNVSNKNQRGKITPSEFNNLTNQSIKAIYSELFSDFRKLNARSNRLQDSPNYGKEAFNLKQAIEYYVKDVVTTVSKDRLKLPADFYAVNSLFGDDAEYQKTDLVQFNRLKSSGRMKPTSSAPIYSLNGGELKIAPAVDNKRLNLVYYRTPKAPKWTYVIVGGTEMFNPDAPDYQDLDIHPMLLHRLFVEIMSLIGINLRDEYISQAVAQMKQVEVMNEQ